MRPNTIGTLGEALTINNRVQFEEMINRHMLLAMRHVDVSALRLVSISDTMNSRKDLLENRLKRRKYKLL